MAFTPPQTPSAGDTIEATHINANMTYVGTYINGTPDIGTPSAGVLTNCSGTAASLTAGAVSTIAGLAPNTATTQAAQPNITSVGTLTTLSVDNITINGNTISSTAGTDLNITPLAGQQVVLDGTVVIDAGVITGATSITSTAFVGDITGDVTGNADTVTTNANLTGPITSSDNATSIASQTGTGTKFVVDTSPTIVTPAIADLTNMTHTHASAAQGGLISDTADIAGRWDLIQSQTASANDFVDFTSISTNYEKLAVVLDRVKPTSDAQHLYMRFSTSGTFQSDAGDYGWAGLYATTSNVPAEIGANSDTKLQLSGQNTGTGTDEEVSGVVYISDLVTSGKAWASINTGSVNTSGNYNLAHCWGLYKTAEVQDGIRFLFASGTIASGTIKLYGLRA